MRENGRFETKLAEGYLASQPVKAPGCRDILKGNRYREVYPFRIGFRGCISKQMGTILNGGNVTGGMGIMV